MTNQLMLTNFFFSFNSLSKYVLMYGPDTFKKARYHVITVHVLWKIQFYDKERLIQRYAKYREDIGYAYSLSNNS